MDVSDAMRARYSVRGFKPEPVGPKTLRAIFEEAQRAPSWCNIQPWRAWVASGERATALKTALTEAAAASMPQPDFEWPAHYPPGYDAWRRACGKSLYDAMGIAREDKAARYAAWMRNYVAFDAPHVAIVGIDKRFGLYAALDVGCWLQSILLCSISRGVSACPQASLATHPTAARAVLGIPDEVGILFGIALGYADPSVAANACRTERAPLEENVTFLE